MTYYANKRERLILSSPIIFNMSAELDGPKGGLRIFASIRLNLSIFAHLGSRHVMCCNCTPKSDPNKFFDHDFSDVGYRVGTNRNNKRVVWIVVLSIFFVCFLFKFFSNVLFKIKSSHCLLHN